jgi:hypothetical protein
LAAGSCRWWIRPGRCRQSGISRKLRATKIDHRYKTEIVALYDQERERKKAFDYGDIETYATEAGDRDEASSDQDDKRIRDGSRQIAINSAVIEC